MAKKVGKNLQRLLQKAQAKERQARLEAKTSYTETKRIPPSKVTKGGAKYPKSLATRITAFLEEIDAIRRSEIQDKMRKEPHVFVINTAQFLSLAKDHKAELNRVALKTEDEELKEQLLNIGGGNTYQLATKLKNRFIEIFETELRKSTILIWRSQVKGGVKLYFIEKDPKKVSGSTTFDLIGVVLTRVRKVLVNNSKAGTITRALSVVIAGLDIDYDRKEIDASKQGLGRVAKSKKLESPVKIKSGQTSSSGTGIQLGHFRGPATEVARRRLELVKKYLSNTALVTKIFSRAEKFHDTVHAFDAEVRFNDVVYDIARGQFNGAVDISIIGLEQTARNSLTGSFTKGELARFRKWIEKNAPVLLTAIGSKPIINIMLDDILRAFIAEKTPSKKINRKYKKRTKFTAKTRSISAQIDTRSDVDKILGLTASEDVTAESLAGIIGLINTRLHDQIQKNMGKGQSKQKLNYRTGRFAKSAEVQALYDVREKNALGAKVKYMRNPYGVFEPGGRLHKPGRDPHRIFGRSIRQILQEEKIANLRRVKVDLGGK